MTIGSITALGPIVQPSGSLVENRSACPGVTPSTRAPESTKTRAAAPKTTHFLIQPSQLAHSRSPHFPPPLPQRPAFTSIVPRIADLVNRVFKIVKRLSQKEAHRRAAENAEEF